MPTPTMSELLAKLENAVAGTTRFDYDIFRAVTPSAANWLDDCPPGGLPCYTTSIDAALTLMPPGAFFHVGKQESDAYAKVTPPLPGRSNYLHAREYEVSAPTPALAVCIAALRARANLPPR